MKMWSFAGFSILVVGCTSSGGSPSTGPVVDGSAPDATHDAASPDAPPIDAASNSDAAQDASSELGDAAGGDASDRGDGAPIDAATDTSDASDGSCPAGWDDVPTPPSALAIPADAGAVRLLLHAHGEGAQTYSCSMLADGGAGWVFVGPQATLDDCQGNAIGSHFPVSAGVNPPPEWKLDGDGSYAIGSKLAGVTPDGGASSIPWLLLGVTSRSDAGLLGQATFVQRLDTQGGLTPSGDCSADGGLDDASAAVPYTAEYYFYGP